MLRLPRILHMEVHKVLCLPRILHMEVHKVLRLPRILHVKKQVHTLITMEGRTGDHRRQPPTTADNATARASNGAWRFTKCCACHEFCTWRFTKCCACHVRCVWSLCVCVCVHSCFQGHYSSTFLIYPTSFSVQKQGDNPMDAVGCPTKRAAFHG